MTILVNQLVRQSYANRLLTEKLSTTGVAVTLYSGAKPTATDYVNNYVASYSSASSAFLWHGSGATTWSSYMVNGVVALYQTAPPTGAVPVHNGVATWGILWTGTATLASMTALPSMATATSRSGGFMVVDVSSTAEGTGVIQLINTTLSTTDTALTLNSVGFSIQ